MSAKHQAIHEKYKTILLNGDKVAMGYGTNERFALRVRDEEGSVICAINDLGLALRNGIEGTHWIIFSSLTPDDMKWLIDNQITKNEGLRKRVEGMNKDLVNMKVAYEVAKMREEFEKKLVR